MSTPEIKIVCKISDGQKNLETLQLSRGVEIGRREPHENLPIALMRRDTDDRLILVDVAERSVSRRHLHIEPLGANMVGVRNLSKNTIQLSGGGKLNPEERREMPLPLGCEIGGRILRFEAPKVERQEFQSLRDPALAPGRQTIDFNLLELPSSVPSLLPSDGPTQQELQLLSWLQASMEVFQSAGGSDDFLPKAAQAAATLIHLDRVAVMSQSDAAWRTSTVCSPEGEASDMNWRPSQTMLKRVDEERRTFYHAPKFDALEAQSLMNVHSIVAAPILNVKNELIGALYGERAANSRFGVKGSISELEVKLFELLAYGVSSGLARQEQERKLIAEKVRFEQFFSPELAHMLESQGESMLAARDALVTVMFCDIKGFSRISAANGAAKSIDWVRDVLSVLSDIVAEFQGVLVDYSGDALEAIWGAPVASPDHAERACRAALKMRAALPELNARWRERIGDETDIAIGINTGVSQVGNIGSRRKFKYGAFGTTVNLASRVQGATKHIGASLLATRSCVDLLPADFARRRLCAIRTVNIDEPVEIHELFSAEHPHRTELRDLYEIALGHFERGDAAATRAALDALFLKHPHDEPGKKLLARANKPFSVPHDSIWTLDGK